MVSLSEKRWRARPRAETGDEAEGFGSGDCDDEDECSGTSGLGPPPRRKRLRVFAEIADNMDDFTFQEQLLTPRLAAGNVDGVSSNATVWNNAPGSLVSVVALLGFCLH
ncbi:glypican-3-like [Eucyclogobius newberryi]|uniref:glypican-3-like n=1 Tax=Eucyclogobius newberryi TaxID=166745 RepID=UPI003B5A740D